MPPTRSARGLETSPTSLLAERGHQPKSVEATAVVHLEEQDTGFFITRIELAVTGEAHGVDERGFLALAEEAKRTCPVSRALAGTEITLSAATTA